MARPSTPIFNIPHPMGPTSPPQTPVTSSPVSNRRGKKPARGKSSAHGASGSVSHRPAYPLAANGPPHQSLRPDQLSPRSSDSSSDESDSASSRSVSPPRSLSSEESSDAAPAPPPRPVPHITARRGIAANSLIVEEMSDFDSEDGRLQVVRPHAIEYADSDRSRSRSRNPSEVDRTVLYGLRDLNCSSSESEGSDLEEAEYNQFRLKQREEKRLKRMTSGSIGKRTITESIGSDTDREDIRALLDASEVGSSARRLRRKVGDRRSLQFQDPPPPRIDELDEPESSDDDMVEVGEALARELPYYTLEYISMEVDSS